MLLADLVPVELDLDVVANPQGPAFLARDVRTITSWFADRGLTLDEDDADELTVRLLAEAGRG